MKWFDVIGKSVLQGVPVHKGMMQGDYFVVVGTLRGKDGEARFRVEKPWATVVEVPADNATDRAIHRVMNADLERIGDGYVIVPEKDPDDRRAVIHWTLEAGFAVEQRMAATPGDLSRREEEKQIVRFDQILAGKGAVIIASRTYPYTRGRPGEICEMLGIVEPGRALFMKRASHDESFGRFRDAVARLLWDGKKISVKFGDGSLFVPTRCDLSSHQFAPTTIR